MRRRHAVAAHSRGSAALLIVGREVPAAAVAPGVANKNIFRGTLGAKLSPAGGRTREAAAAAAAAATVAALVVLDMAADSTLRPLPLHETNN